MEKPASPSTDLQKQHMFIKNSRSALTLLKHPKERRLPLSSIFKLCGTHRARVYSKNASTHGERMARYLYLYPDPETETQNVPQSSSHSLFIGRSREGRLLTVKPDQMAASESTCISPAQLPPVFCPEIGL